MIFDRGLVAAGDDQNRLDPARDRFLDRVLDERLIDERQHFLGLAFVAGRNRVPSPAAGKTALRILFVIPNLLNSINS